MFKLASKTTKRGPSLSAQVSMQAQSPAIGATATRSITSNEFILNHSIDSRRRKAAVSQVIQMRVLCNMCF